jgi:hypothetical protein
MIRAPVILVWWEISRSGWECLAKVRLLCSSGLSNSSCTIYLDPYLGIFHAAIVTETRDNRTLGNI